MPFRQNPRNPGTGNGEDGYLLIGVLFLIVVLLIGLALAAPKVATEIRRDKELELYHRGMQYTRAIKLYYKKFGRYPVSMDQLERSNNLRFLRKRYNDPFTGKPDWRIIHVGEAKVAQTGLFGQPLGVTGAGNSTGNGQQGSNSSSFGNSGNSFGQSGNSASSFGNSSFGGSSNGSSPFGNSFSNNSGQSSFGSSSSNPTDPNSGQAGNGTGTSGFGSSNTGGTTGLGNSSLTSSSGSPIGSAGPMIGVASSLPKESIREFRNQKHYNQWEFVYNPQADLGGLGGNTGMGVLGQGGNTLNAPGSGFSSNNGSSFGNNSSFGNGNGSTFGSSFGNGSNSNSGNPNGNNSNPPANPNPTPTPAPPVQMDPPNQ
jgi:type II secretory pathway pseudopilin PulG